MFRTMVNSSSCVPESCLVAPPCGTVRTLTGGGAAGFVCTGVASRGGGSFSGVGAGACGCAFVSGGGSCGVGCGGCTVDGASGMLSLPGFWLEFLSCSVEFWGAALCAELLTTAAARTQARTDHNTSRLSNEDPRPKFCVLGCLSR